MVWIDRAKPIGHWTRSPEEPEYGGHWEVDEPRPHIEEEGPGWDDVEEAIAWGRERAPKVMVILGDEYYSAGEEQAGTAPEWPPPGWKD